MSVTATTDLITPSIYVPYQQRLTEAKSRLVQSGAMVRNPKMDALLAGGGLTFHLPNFRDLADTEANASLGATGSAATALNIAADDEIAARISRNQAWGSVDLTEALAGEDPQMAIAQRVAGYWTRSMQRHVLDMLKGIFADDTVNDAGSFTSDISGVYSDGVTNFSARAFLGAAFTMGDSESDLAVVIMHSTVYQRALTLNLIDMVADSSNPEAAAIKTFLGREVIVDDGLTAISTGLFQTLLLGRGAIQLGVGVPKVPVETFRSPLDAAGGGTETLVSRVEWMFHVPGESYIGTSPASGPIIGAGANQLGAAGSWNRVATERKQVKIARLLSQEFAS